MKAILVILFITLLAGCGDPEQKVTPQWVEHEETITAMQYVHDGNLSIIEVTTDEGKYHFEESQIPEGKSVAVAQIVKIRKFEPSDFKIVYFNDWIAGEIQ